VDFTASSLITTATALIYLMLIAVVLRYQDSAEQPVIRLLLSTLGLGMLASIFALLPDDALLLDQNALSQPALMVYTSSFFLVMFGVLTTAYLQQKNAMRFWVAVGLLWWGVLALSGFNDSAFTDVEWINNLSESNNNTHWLAIGGWVVIALLLLWNTFWKYYTARLPELANQALFWGVVTPLVVVGVMLSASSVEFLQEMGWIIQIVGVSGITYGIVSLRVLDIRETMRNAAITMALSLVTTVVILVALLVADEAEVDTNISREVILGGLALAAATLHAPLYVASEFVLRRILRTSSRNATSNINRFSAAITGIVELNELTDLIDDTLRQGLQVRRAELLLSTEDLNNPNIVHIEPHRATLTESTPLMVLGSLQKEGLLYTKLQNSRKPILQYALDFSKEFSDINPTERQFFQKLRMAVYTPIVLQERLIGILAAGPKTNDAPFSDADLELLTSIANQTGIALRNARLVDDLRKREQDLEKTNANLESAKRRLEATDAVKTDFITIASHELRTPLAQIRGHSDIISALGSQGALSPEHLSSLTDKLRNATDRLETLIGDMLDVSRLDLSALDLSFSQTTAETVVRLAIEPLQESIRERKQSLTAKGLRNLPQLEADAKRVVQAVRNLVLNAVKFTPDGGRIEIAGELLNNAETGTDEIQIKVQDSGIGIDKKNQEAIFEKFFRIGDPGLHSTGTTKFMGAGPGLGLTIAKGVVEGHGGRIWVESEKHDTEELPGSTFYIVLPLKPPTGARRVLGFGAGNAAPPLGTNGNTTSAPATVSASGEPDTAKHEVFEETDPTVLNPSASRAGLAAAAAKAALEQANTSPEDEDAGKTDTAENATTSPPKADSK
jgi:signal transduction histidine kinase